MTEFADKYRLVLKEVCKLLDAQSRWCGNYEQVAKIFGVDQWSIRNLERHERGPTECLFEYLRFKHPDLALGELFTVLKDIGREDVVAVLRDGQKQSTSDSDSYV